MIELILGGSRSGKSSYAEQQASASGKPVIYIATAQANDSQMQARIVCHQHARPQHWKTIEEPLQLAKIIHNQHQKNTCLLVDCLTLWLNNILFNQQGELQEKTFEDETQSLYAVLPQVSGRLILVTNEVGLGGVASNPMARRFTDEAGLLHQKIATLSDRVVLVTAGLPQVLK